MKTFSVSEALIYLNEVIPDGLAPKNEETIRRAIRSGELKAQRNFGREGNKIEEKDLLEYAKKYHERADKFKKSIIAKSAEPNEAAGVKTAVSFTQVLKKNLEADRLVLKLELLENKKAWEEKRSSISNQIFILKNELSACENEIKLFEEELEKM